MASGELFKDVVWVSSRCVAGGVEIRIQFGIPVPGPYGVRSVVLVCHGDLFYPFLNVGAGWIGGVGSVYVHYS